jgi:hypothetical protein
MQGLNGVLILPPEGRSISAIAKVINASFFNSKACELLAASLLSPDHDFVRRCLGEALAMDSVFIVVENSKKST